MLTEAGRAQTVPITFGPMMVDWETRIDFEKMRQDRLQRTRDAMARAGLDYLILARGENARYTTGVKRLHWPTIRLGSGPAVVLPQQGDPGVWIVDIDFASRVLTWLPKEHIKTGYELDLAHEVEWFARDIRELFGPDVEGARIGVDLWSPAMHDVLPAAFPRASFVNGQDVMQQAKQIKTEEEILCLKMGYAISEAGMQAAVDALKPGVRECELVGICFKKFGEYGSETAQCSEVVNSGPGSYPYRRFHTDRIIQAGEMVNMDFGACFAGYFGDFCRAFVCGRKPTQEQLDLLRRSYDMQMSAIDAIRPGASAAGLCRKLNMRMIGHGIGISAFENPHLRITDEYEIQEGMVFCVTVPVIGSPTAGGVHLEDQVVIRKNGCEVYSTYPYTGVDE